MKTDDINNNDQTWGRTNNESYIWEKEGHQEHHDHGLTEKSRNDNRIQSDIQALLTKDNFLDASNITVTVTDGEATLKGTVLEENDKQRAEDLSVAVPGVERVQNRISVKGNGSSDDTENDKPSSEHHYKGLIRSQSTSPKSIF